MGAQRGLKHFFSGTNTHIVDKTQTQTGWALDSRKILVKNRWVRCDL